MGALPAAEGGRPPVVTNFVPASPAPVGADAGGTAPAAVSANTDKPTSSMRSVGDARTGDGAARVVPTGFGGSAPSSRLESLNEHEPMRGRTMPPNSLSYLPRGTKGGEWGWHLPREVRRELVVHFDVDIRSEDPARGEGNECAGRRAQ